MRKQRAVRSSAPAFAFIGSASITCAGMRQICDYSDVLCPAINAAMALLVSGWISWFGLSRWRDGRPILCWVVIGMSSGIGGAGAFMLPAHLLSSVFPVEWIPPTPAG